MADLATILPKSGRRRVMVLPVATALVLIVLVWFGAAGVRGSDQYWYVADVESLIEGRGVQTNEIYPVSVRHDIAPLPRPFIHNVLSIYIVALPALLFGAYGGWIVVNVLSSLLTAFLIYCTVIRFSHAHAAMAAGSAYLLLPVTSWLTMQPLAEASIAPLVALTTYAYVTANAAYWRWMLLVFLAALLVYARASFIVLLPLVPVAYLIHARPLGPKTLAGAAGLAGLAAALWMLGHAIFEPHISVSYTQVLVAGSPNVSNTNSYFDWSPDPPTISAVLAKIGRGLAVQFTDVGIPYLLFYLPFNVMALAPFMLLLGPDRREVARVSAAGLVALALHLATATLVQNQFRYLLVATPPLLVCLGIVVGRIRWPSALRLPVAAVAVVALMTVPNTVLAWRSHTEGLDHRETRARLHAVFGDTVGSHDPTMVMLDLTRGFEVQVLSYVLRPRPILYVSDRYGTDDYAALIRNVNAEWLIARRDSVALDRMAAAADGIREVRALPVPFDEWSLFSIGNDGSAATPGQTTEPISAPSQSAAEASEDSGP